MLNTFHKSSGFSLIEMMIAVALVGLLLVMGVPSYRTWIQNTQIRTAAESVQNGMQKARAEAVTRNTNITFVLTGTAPQWASSWNVSVLNPASSIESRSGGEGSKNVTAMGYDSASATATTITFNNLGAIGVPPNQPLNANGSAPLARVEFDSAVLPGNSRNLRITISTGGSVKMCDPNLAAGSSPRAC